MSRKGRDLRDVARQGDWLEVSTNPDPERDRKIADEKLCLWLLAGYSVDEGKYGKAYFPKTGSADEWAARAALARCIRDHMKGFVAEFLALAIDPHTPSPPPMVTKPIRFIRFDKPRGMPPTVLRDLRVVDFIMRQRSGKEDAALLAAEREFGLGKSRTHAIWMAHKQRVGESGPPKKKQKRGRRHRSTKSPGN